MGYTDFLGLMDGAALILTDSGGIQEEACILGVPCLTLRENTERPVTVTCGGNQLVGRDLARIVAAAERVLKESQPAPRRPELWDGHAAQRIAKDLWNRYGSKA
jgi:UDP-N-acetylglucosamine 2-epimerase (non-hydrolysing)